MSDLINRIRMAQVRAAEDAVCQDLSAKGLGPVAATQAATSVAAPKESGGMTIAKAIHQGLRAEVWLDGGKGPLACVGICAIQLQGWWHTAESAKAFADGYNRGLDDLRAALPLPAVVQAAPGDVHPAAPQTTVPTAAPFSEPRALGQGELPVRAEMENADTLRLDWLEKRRETVYVCSHTARRPSTMPGVRYEESYAFDGWAVFQDDEPKRTIRDAIDAAMSAPGGGGRA